MIDPIVIHLDSKRRKRGQFAQKLQHAVPAGPLLVNGMAALRRGAHGFELGLAIVEVVTSAFLILTIVREFRAMRRGTAGGHPHDPHGVDWAHIWSAGVLFAEVGERWHLHHHLARPMILTAVFTLVLGIYHGRIAARAGRRRSLRIDQAGVELRLFFRRTLRIPWKELAAIEIGDRDATIRARDGRAGRLNLADLDNAQDIRRALQSARGRIEGCQERS
jgi:hypothetical protein